jgi:hypothetical protein
MFPPIIGLKLPAVVKARPKIKNDGGKSVSRNCAHRAKKRQVCRKNLIIVCQKYPSCCIPLSGANRLSRKENS